MIVDLGEQYLSKLVHAGEWKSLAQVLPNVIQVTTLSVEGDERSLIAKKAERLVERESFIGRRGLAVQRICVSSLGLIVSWGAVGGGSGLCGSKSCRRCRYWQKEYQQPK